MDGCVARGETDGLQCTDIERRQRCGVLQGAQIANCRTVRTGGLRGPLELVPALRIPANKDGRANLSRAAGKCYDSLWGGSSRAQCVGLGLHICQRQDAGLHNRWPPTKFPEIEGAGIGD